MDIIFEQFSQTMIIFPNAKVNLGLNIISKRSDGFHNIESIFFPVAIHDALEFVVADKMEFTLSGLVVNGNVGDNLVLKAYHLLKKDFDLPPLKIHLYKNIPMGAGLGGGSSDASFFLKALNQYFKLNISTNKLIEYAAQLGSDCAFFILNQPCFSSGRGEELTPIELNLAGKKMMVIHPAISVNTAWAYSKIKPSQPLKAVKEIIAQPILTWKTALINDFEMPVFQEFPAIEKIKQQLYGAGAIYASLSGSGSAVFGIFENEIPTIQFPDNYFLGEYSI